MTFVDGLTELPNWTTTFTNSFEGIFKYFLNLLRLKTSLNSVIQRFEINTSKFLSSTKVNSSSSFDFMI